MVTTTVERTGKLAVQVSEAAEISGVGRTVLYGAMSCGELPFLRIGASRRIMVADLEAWLLRHRVASDEPDAA